MPERLEVWRKVAAEYGGVATAWTRARSTAFFLVVTHEHTRIVITGRNYPYGGAGGPGRQWGTLSGVAQAAGTEGLRVDIRSDRPSFWAGLFGWIELVDSGHPAFDRQFRVMATDTGWARTWLSGHAKNLLLATPTTRVRIQKGRVEVRKSTAGAPCESELKELVASLAALSSSRALELRTEWNRLAEEIDGRLQAQGSDSPAAKLIRLDGNRPPFELTSPPTIEVRRNPLVFHLRARVAKERSRPRLRTVLEGQRRSHASGRFVLGGCGVEPREIARPRTKLVDVGKRGAWATGEPDSFFLECVERVLPLVDELGDETVVIVDSKVRVEWPGLETQTRVVEAGIAAASELSIDRDRGVGPYR